MREPLVAHQLYRVVNPDAADYTRIGLLIGVVTKDDDPDVQPVRIVRFPDGSAGVFYREELEPYAARPHS